MSLRNRKKIAHGVSFSNRHERRAPASSSQYDPRCEHRQRQSSGSRRQNVISLLTYDNDDDDKGDDRQVEVEENDKDERIGDELAKEERSNREKYDEHSCGFVPLTGSNHKEGTAKLRARSASTRQSVNHNVKDIFSVEKGNGLYKSYHGAEDDRAMQRGEKASPNDNDKKNHVKSSSGPYSSRASVPLSLRKNTARLEIKEGSVYAADFQRMGDIEYLPAQESKRTPRRKRKRRSFVIESSSPVNCDGGIQGLKISGKNPTRSIEGELRRLKPAPRYNKRIKPASSSSFSELNGFEDDNDFGREAQNTGNQKRGQGMLKSFSDDEKMSSTETTNQNKPNVKAGRGKNKPFHDVPRAMQRHRLGNEDDPSCDDPDEFSLYSDDDEEVAHIRRERPIVATESLSSEHCSKSGQRFEKALKKMIERKEAYVCQNEKWRKLLIPSQDNNGSHLHTMTMTSLNRMREELDAKIGFATATCDSLEVCCKGHGESYHEAYEQEFYRAFRNSCIGAGKRDLFTSENEGQERALQCRSANENNDCYTFRCVINRWWNANKASLLRGCNQKRENLRSTNPFLADIVVVDSKKVKLMLAEERQRKRIDKRNGICDHENIVSRHRGCDKDYVADLCLQSFRMGREQNLELIEQAMELRRRQRRLNELTTKVSRLQKQQQAYESNHIVQRATLKFMKENQTLIRNMAVHSTIEHGALLSGIRHTVMKKVEDEMRR